MSTYHILIVLLCIYCIIEFSELFVRIRFMLLKRRMLRAIAENTECKGHILPPDDEEPLAIDAATGMRQYIFVEEAGQGERMIFVSKDCSCINIMPWRMLNDRFDHQVDKDEEDPDEQEEIQEAS